MFGTMWSKCNPIQRTIIPTTIVKIVVVVNDKDIAWPISQRIHPSKKNPPTLPAWNESCVLTCFRVP